MVLQDDADRVKHLLAEAISVLCKNGLSFESELTVEGLLGITLDNSDIFLVNINETITTEGRKQQQTSATKSRVSASKEKSSQSRHGKKRGHDSQPSPEPSAKRSTRKSNATDLMDIKTEKISVADDTSSYGGDDAGFGLVSFEDASQDDSNSKHSEVVAAKVKEPSPPTTQNAGASTVKGETKDRTVVTSTSSRSVGTEPRKEDKKYDAPQAVDLPDRYETDMNLPRAIDQSPSASCQTTFDTFMTNVKKNKESSPGYNKLLKCADCDIVFSNRVELKSHMVQAHSRNEFKCKYCGKSFLTITGLQSHLPLHDGQWKFTCHLCGKGFQRKLDFEGHMNKHNNIKFICPNCEGSFYHKANWLKHQSRCTK